MRGLFPSGGQSIGASASASVLPVNIQVDFLLGLTGLISKWAAIPFSGDLPDPGIEPGSPALQVDSLLSAPPGKPYDLSYVHGKITFSLSIHPLIITLVFSMFDYCE